MRMEIKLDIERWYPYESRFKDELPLPIIENVVVLHPYDKEKFLYYKAKIDTGADITCIPIEAKELLNLQPCDIVQTCTYRGDEISEDMVRIGLCFEKFKSNLNVIATKRKSVLIGRDILNRWILLLDGKKNRWSFTDC